jgi:carbonic anhydrase
MDTTKSYVPKQMHFNVNDEHVIKGEYFNMETNAV